MVILVKHSNTEIMTGISSESLITHEKREKSIKVVKTGICL